MDSPALWNRYKSYLFLDPETGFSLDISRMKFEVSFFSSMEERMHTAFASMDALERGEIANPDEKRMVGHYWLRSPELAPSAQIRQSIESTLVRIKDFARDVHTSKIRPEHADRFKHLLVVGIGGSALGPQLVSRALGQIDDKMSVHFFDNTDPDGMNLVLSGIPDLRSTLVAVISKSGGTKETRNGQLVARQALSQAGVNFARHALAITGENSELDKTADREGWLARFPMWDWIGGRTSELSAVGLLPAALQGIVIDEMLSGARHMDEITRVPQVAKNPAALLALMWYYATGGKGAKDMVILPYRDRLDLMSRYLQQLVMESLGKERDLNERIVHQGISVYGNKGSTDQHAYVQQLRDGVPNFFATFIEVLKDSSEFSPHGPVSPSFEVEPGITSGDYLSGFFLGTRRALFDNNRESLTITIPEISPSTLGMLIALYERAVGLYASLINVNAYHQPGVEAGKKAAAEVLKAQTAIVDILKKGAPMTVDEIAAALGAVSEPETVFHVVRRLAATGRVVSSNDKDPIFARYSCSH